MGLGIGVSRGLGAGGPYSIIDSLGSAQERGTLSLRVVRRILAYARPNWALVAAAAALMLAGAGLSLLTPYLVKVAIDVHIASGDASGLSRVALCTALAYIVLYGASAGQTYLLSLVSQRALMALRSALYRHLLTMHLGYHDTHIVGVTISRLINDVDVIHALLSQGLVSIVGDLTLVLGTVVVMLSLNPRLALLALSITPLMVVATLVFTHFARLAFRETRTKIGAVVGDLAESIGGMRVIQAFAQEQATLERFDQMNAANRDAHVSAVAVASGFTGVVDLLSILATAAVLWFGGRAVASSELTLGTVVAFLAYVGQLFQPIRDLSQIFGALQSAMAGGERVVEILDTTPQVADAPGAPDLSPVEGRVEFRDVWLDYRAAPAVLPLSLRRERDGVRVDVVREGTASEATVEPCRVGPGHAGSGNPPSPYPLPQGEGAAAVLPPLPPQGAGALLPPLPEGEGGVRGENANTNEPALRGISFTVAPGEMVAFVGHTGAGKTSIASLLVRFYDVTAGQILIDGTDIRTVTQASLRRQIGLVPQDPFLFAATIADNIRFGRPAATDDEVRAAAKLANVDELIASLPEGYETHIQEGGVNLSQGQRQLLCIARVALTAPRLLILDEATSSVDTLTETLIKEALARLLQGRTAIVIAHRLSTIRRADRIHVMEAGRIVESGRHDELLARRGAYWALCQKQWGVGL
ncbi:MAG: ABC transporter transmembrane domain-containing protein [Anaerolineae bacterium]